MLYWCDVPGQDKQVRKVLSIGIHRTRTIAERAAAEKLEKLGVNSTQAFIETTSSNTFKQQAEVWLKSLTNRKRIQLNRRRSTHADTPGQVNVPLFRGEWSLIAERVRAGLRNARAKGRTLGRPRVTVDRQEIEALRVAGASWKAIASRFDVGVGTAYAAIS